MVGHPALTNTMTRAKPSSVLVTVLVAVLVMGCGLSLAGELVIPPAQDPGGDGAANDDAGSNLGGDAIGGGGMDDGPTMIHPPGGPEGGTEAGQPGACDFLVYCWY
jgi:hypothetical protein